MMTARISRRTVLRGLGTAVALPVAGGDGCPRSRGRGGRRGAAAAARMAFLYVPNGVNMADWTPATEGADFELPPILEPLAALPGTT